MERSEPTPRPAAVAIVATLLACAAAAWLFTISESASIAMNGMAMMGAGLFMVTWLVMMVAMMFPSVAPITLTFASATRSRGSFAPTVAFVLAYLLVWTAAGLVPLAVQVALNQVWAAPPSWLPRVGGAVIILAGIYQFTPLKHACLRACRSPLGLMLGHNFGGGSVAAARTGASHGVYCLGCCWALMAVLAVLGMMNVVLMAVIAAVVFVEKHARFGFALPRVVGVACIVAGLVIATAA